MIIILHIIFIYLFHEEEINISVWLCLCTVTADRYRRYRRFRMFSNVARAKLFVRRPSSDGPAAAVVCNKSLAARRESTDRRRFVVASVVVQRAVCVPPLFRVGPRVSVRRHCDLCCLHHRPFDYLCHLSFSELPTCCSFWISSSPRRLKNLVLSTPSHAPSGPVGRVRFLTTRKNGRIIQPRRALCAYVIRNFVRTDRSDFGPPRRRPYRIVNVDGELYNNIIVIYRSLTPCLTANVYYIRSAAEKCLFPSPSSCVSSPVGRVVRACQADTCTTSPGQRRHYFRPVCQASAV